MVGKVPLVDWTRAIGLIDPNDPRTPKIYRAYLPLSLFDIRTWTEIWPLAEQGYDWSEYTVDGTYPPITVFLGCWKYPFIWVEDGHHRISYWRANGFLLAPSLVIDYGISKEHLSDFSADSSRSLLPLVP